MSDLVAQPLTLEEMRESISNLFPWLSDEALDRMTTAMVTDFLMQQSKKEGLMRRIMPPEPITIVQYQSLGNDPRNLAPRDLLDQGLQTLLFNAGIPPGMYPIKLVSTPQDSPNPYHEAWEAAKLTAEDDFAPRKEGMMPDEVAARVLKFDYEVFTPDVPQILGTIFAFHGFTETAKKMRGYSKLDEIGQALGLRVVYLDGWLYHWDFWRKPAHNRSMKYVSDLFTELMGHNTKIVMVGFSAGACMVNSLAAYYPGMFLGAVSYSGYLAHGWEMSVLGKFPAMVLRNAEDKLVDQAETDELIAAYERAGRPVELLCPSGGTAYDGIGQFTNHFWDVNANPAIQQFIAKCFQEPPASHGAVGNTTGLDRIDI